MKKFISRIVANTHKRILSTAALAFVAALSPVAVSAAQAQSVQIEAQSYVANYTAGDTTWNKTSVNATYDQVVKIDVTYDNDEAAGSGKIANNLHVKINIPSAAGASETVTTTTSADNSNTVNGSVKVNLDRSDAYLQYIPGSAVWKHAVSPNSSQTTETSISDSVVTNANGLVLENENPCQAGSVVVEARVMVPGVRIVKQSEILGQNNQWSNDNNAQPGDTLKYMITYQNVGNTEQKNVVIGDNLPPKMMLVPNTTYVYNTAYPNGTLLKTDSITSGGVTIGNYMPGATAYIVFEVKIPKASDLACGNTQFRNVGVVQPEGMGQYYNTAITNVMKQCTPNTPTTPVTPTQLPNTGAGNVLGLFAGATVAGSIGYRLFLSRRLARR